MLADFPALYTTHLYATHLSAIAADVLTMGERSLYRMARASLELMR